jgi:biopolymer transport protein ExbB/TolQ
MVTLVLSLIMQWSIVPGDAYLYRLFRPTGGWVMSLVPGFIAFVFIWTLTDLFLKFRIGRVTDRDLRRPDIVQLPQLVSREPTSATLQRLRTWDRASLARPVGRRLLWVLHHLNTTEAQRAHELLRHQSDLDADSAASSYRTVKLFIWAMPILGFIGTVLGISLAVGGFSEFLSTSVSIDEIDRVTAELGNVASGLSFAFDTTLIGLLAGLVATVVSSSVEKREERMLTQLDELGLRVLESASPEAAASEAVAAPVQPVGAPSAEFDQMMRERLRDLSAQMDGFTRSVQSGLDGFLGEWSKLPPEIEKVAADLVGLRQHLSSAAGSTDRLISETSTLMEGLAEVSSRIGTELEQSIGSVGQTVEGLESNLDGISGSLGGYMTRMEEANQRLAEAITELAPVLSQLSGPMEVRLTPVAAPRREG